ncbi:MAG: hypothetical protein HYV63_16415 [Candidatus Schekmanbacteria bacterium]|nr:hypothetical protein [Candidatus Schekmanbacteria bacterium]
MTSPTAIFGGTPYEEVAEIASNGFATWVDTDDKDQEGIVAHGAMLVDAPVDIVFNTVTDFESSHKFIPVARPGKILERNGSSVTVKLSQGIGMGIVSFGLEEVFRLRLHPPTWIECEEYVKGPFERASFELYLFPIGDRTLTVLSFISDLRALHWLTSLFFVHQPEIEFAIAANMLLIPLSGYAAESERRAAAGAPRRSRQPARALWDALGAGKLAPAVRHGYLTACRLDLRGNIVDVASATKVGASRPDVWRVTADPAYLCEMLSFVTDGRIVARDHRTLTSEVTYRIKIGPFSRQYRLRRRARYEEPAWLEAEEAHIEGQPATEADYLYDEGSNTLLCHVYYSDIKRDWLSGMFLKKHPEFERLICTYAPIIRVRAMRTRFGAPFARG